MILKVKSEKKVIIINNVFINVYIIILLLLY